MFFAFVFCFNVGGDESRAISFKLTASRICEQERIEVTLSLCGDRGICGAFAELSYDSDKLVFLGCDISDDKEKSPLTLSYLDRGGAVRFLLDGEENHGGESRLISFYFALKDGDYTRAEFKLSGVGERCVISVDDEGGLEVMDAVFPSCSIYLGDRGEILLPILTGCDIEEREAGFFLIPSGKVCDGNAFAVGFKLFAIELDGGEAHGITVSQIILRGEGERDFTQEIYIGSRRNLSVVITPITYTSSGYREGEKSVRLVK